MTVLFVYFHDSGAFPVETVTYPNEKYPEAFFT
jgi:hypothetical protein